MRSKRRNLFFACIVAFVLLGIAECGLRVADMAKGASFGEHMVAKENTLFYTRHPFLGLTVRPNQRMHMKDGAGIVTVNENGFRGESLPIEAPAGVRRVAVMGGSVVFGTGADDADTFPLRMESALVETTGAEWQVLNAGVPGFTSLESLIRYASQASDYRPDYAVLYQAYNDLKMIDPVNFRSDYTHMKGTLGERSIGQRLFGNLKLYRKLRDVLQTRTKVMYFVQEAGGGMGATAGSRDTFERNVRGFVGLAKASGAKPVLSTFAMPLSEEVLNAHPHLRTDIQRFIPSLTMEGVRSALADYNGLIREVAEEEGALLLDGWAVLADDGANFIDHCHLSPIGAERLGRAFAALIATDGTTAPAAAGVLSPGIEAPIDVPEP